MSHLGIDPDLHHTGLAIVDIGDAVLGVHCCVVPAKHKGAEAVVAMTQQLAGALSVIAEQGHSITDIAIEGQTITFTTILLPHVPSPTPSVFIEPPPDSGEKKWIEVAADTDDLTVVRAISEMDPANKLRSDTWVMINTTAKPASAGPLASDGLIAVVGAPSATPLKVTAISGSSGSFERSTTSPSSKPVDRGP